jgi:hypothetical protein
VMSVGKDLNNQETCSDTGEDILVIKVSDP